MDLTKQFFKYVSQNIFGLLGTSCYILADTYFIAQAAGTDGVTLLNLCLPIYNFIFAIGSMIALGSATRYAIAKAQNDARGQRYFSNAILCAVLASIPWMLAGAFVPGALLRLMGGDAGIVTAADGDFCVGHSFKVDGLLRLGDGGGGAEGHGELHRHPVGDAAVDAAAVIGSRPDPPTICTPRVVGLTAPEGGKLLPGPEGHRLHAGDGEHVAGDLRLHRLPPIRAAPAGGQARDDAAHLTTHGVPSLAGRLRPLAQGIFVNFLNVQKTGRMKLPFGIAQIGKAFRNEIVARQFIFRMREFEQMEMQFFVRPGTEMEWWNRWKETRMAWHRALGFGDDNYRFHDHEKLAHYANAATDIEYNFPFGFKEVEGIHSRTDFDLGNHQKFSGRKIQYFDPETGESYVPYVVETSIGVDRMFLQVMSAAYTEETLDGGDSRVVLRLPAALAPVKVAVLPLVKKDGMPEVAQRIVDELKYDYNVIYDEKDSVGKRYRRQDAIGTPFCVTVDGQTLEDGTVTVRHRDSMEQERVQIEALPSLVEKECSYRRLFGKLNL